jgi:thiol-disulfide isomerase/thioredoxin
MARSSGSVLAVLGLVSLLAAGCGLTYIVPAAAGSAEQRQAMPDLLLGDGTAMPVHLRHYAGNVILLNFWAMSCGPCVKELVFLNRLQGDLPGQPLVVMPVNVDATAMATIKDFLARQKLTYLKPFADPTGNAANALGVRGLPSSVIIDKKGRVVQAVEGPVEWDQPAVVARFRELLKE